MVKRIQTAEQQSNGVDEISQEYSGSGENHVRSFDVVDVADLSVKDVAFDKVHNRSQNGACFAPLKSYYANMSRNCFVLPHRY